MRYSKGDNVYFKLPMAYKMNSIEYKKCTGTVTEVHEFGYMILPDGYDTPQYVPEQHVFERKKPKLI